MVSFPLPSLFKAGEYARVLTSRRLRGARGRAGDLRAEDQSVQAGLSLFRLAGFPAKFQHVLQGVRVGQNWPASAAGKQGVST